MSELVDKAAAALAEGRLRWHTNPVMARAVIKAVLEALYQDTSCETEADFVLHFAKRLGIALDE